MPNLVKGLIYYVLITYAIITSLPGELFYTLVPGVTQHQCARQPSGRDITSMQPLPRQHHCERDVSNILNITMFPRK